VSRFGALVLVVALSACAQTRPSIPRGYEFPDSNTGVAILRLEYEAGYWRRLPLDFSNHLPPVQWLASGSGGRWYDVEPVGEGAASDFYAALPAGDYRMLCNTEIGEVCRFRIDPGEVAYTGMLRVRGKQTVPYDEYEAAAQRFRARHPELAGRLKKSLMRIYATGRDGYLEEQAWQGPAHRIAP
jgi:hypothetical protein